MGPAYTNLALQDYSEWASFTALVKSRTTPIIAVYHSGSQNHVYAFVDTPEVGISQFDSNVGDIKTNTTIQTDFPNVLYLAQIPSSINYGRIVTADYADWFSMVELLKSKSTMIVINSSVNTAWAFVGLRAIGAVVLTTSGDILSTNIQTDYPDAISLTTANFFS